MHRMNGRTEKCKALGRNWPLLFIALVIVAAHAAAAGSLPGSPEPVPTIVTVPATLVPLDPPEVFGPDTLFEKINGQAELYLSAGFVRLTSQWFAEAENRDAMFEMYIYDMGDGLNAFSVFSAQRREDARKIGLTPFAYRTANSLHLSHGAYYAEMFLASPSETVWQEMMVLAQNFVKETPANPASIDVFTLFPEERLDRDSISLIASDAFGFGGLDRVFTAGYDMEDGKITAFVSKRKTAREARGLVLDFHGYLLAFGGREATPDIAVDGAKMVEIMDTHDIMFAVGDYLAGVHEAPAKQQAEALAESLYKRLRSLSNL